ncbi:MAG: hypothetical protein V2A73_00760 [Pseudomonadota bacterium]
MSRWYRNETFVSLDREATKDDAAKVEEAFADEWAVENWALFDDQITVWGEGSLCGGESESEAHARITRKIRELIPKCRVETQWTYLEDLPYTSSITESGEEPTVEGG